MLKPAYFSTQPEKPVAAPTQAPDVKVQTVRPGAETHRNYRALWFFLMFGVGGLAYMKFLETNEIVNTKVNTYQVAGKLELGGPFSGLIDQDGKPANSDQYIGQYPLIYFGFTHCPDICPTELKKMMKALDIVSNHVSDATPPSRMIISFPPPKCISSYVIVVVFPTAVD